MTATPEPEAQSAPPLHAVGLWAFAAGLHLAWGLVVPKAEYADAFYYDGVARSIASGNGALTGAAWNLSWLPSSLPMPADLYWMPLPSRVLVPALVVSPELGAIVTTALIGALWAPLAWALALHLGASRGTAILAGVLAAFGGEYVRDLSMPDSFALAGAIGGAAWLAAARGSVPIAAFAVFLFTLTRNDGLLLAPFVFLALGVRRGWPVLLAGMAGPMLWGLRNQWIGGDRWMAFRRATGGFVDIGDLIAGTATSGLHLGPRLAAIAESWSLLPAFFLGAGLFVLPPFALYEGWRRRSTSWVVAAMAFWIVIGPAVLVLSPGAANNGTLMRTGAAFFPVQCALAAIALVAFDGWCHRERGYPARMVTGLVLGAFVFITGVVGAKKLARVHEKVAEDCAILESVPRDAVVFSWGPLHTWRHCGHPAVVLPQAIDPTLAAELAHRYDIRWALAGPPILADAVLAREEHVPEMLPGWEKVGDRLFRAPAAPVAAP